MPPRGRSAVRCSGSTKFATFSQTVSVAAPGSNTDKRKEGTTEREGDGSEKKVVMLLFPSVCRGRRPIQRSNSRVSPAISVHCGQAAILLAYFHFPSPSTSVPHDPHLSTIRLTAEVRKIFSRDVVNATEGVYQYVLSPEFFNAVVCRWCATVGPRRVVLWFCSREPFFVHLLGPCDRAHP